MGLRETPTRALASFDLSCSPAAVYPPPYPLPQKQHTMAAQTPRQKFEAVFPVIADEILAYMQAEGMPQDARDWMKRVRSPSSFLADELLSDTLNQEADPSNPFLCARGERQHRTCTTTRPEASSTEACRSSTPTPSSPESRTAASLTKSTSRPPSSAGASSSCVFYPLPTLTGLPVVRR